MNQFCFIVLDSKIAFLTMGNYKFYICTATDCYIKLVAYAVLIFLDVMVDLVRCQVNHIVSFIG